MKEGRPGAGAVADTAVRIARVRERIAAACARAGRDPAAVRLVAVSKTHPAERVREALAAGIVDIGENYAQELVDKRTMLSDLQGVRWHFIGHLQRNKARLVAGQTHLVHAVDSAALACELDRRAGALGVRQDVLVAVNLAKEATKSGVSADQVAALLDSIAELTHLCCRGLMTMPPPGDPEGSRRYFAALRQLRDRLATAATPLPELSMGMSADLEVAVEEGATLVRVGTDIFGARG